MREDRQRSLALCFVLLLLFTSSLPLLQPLDEQNGERSQLEQWVQFDVKTGVYYDAVGIMNDTLEPEQRAMIAAGPFGTFDTNGLTLARPVPSAWLEPRFDLLLLLVSNDMRMSEVRHELDEVPGLAVREFIAPSGLLVQGTPYALHRAEIHPAIATSHAVPLGMLVDQDLLDVLLLSDGEQSLQQELLRLEGWRDDNGPLETVELVDDVGGILHQSLGEVARQAFSEAHAWDDGRYEGMLQTVQLEALMMQPSVMYLRADPAFVALNDQAQNHMQTNSMTTFFTTDLDGSGQIVAVADSGLDADHGDFGTRVIGSYDVIGDGSTADKYTGHGTHVSCTVLGDGFRGGYGGVVEAAELYFQAMENDNTGNFQSPSLNNLLNTAYNAGARTHTNSWGSSDNSQQSKYNSETEDVDSRANTYDRYYNGVEGLTILFAAGNDGPNAGTVSPPATAKNVISVGNHLNRGGGSPNSMVGSSSRGPTEDGRIKPDIIAPGGFVRSCKAQEATTTGGSSWSNTYYMEYTGTSMATPNAAGVAVMIREYLIEIAQRPSPQGALVKALMVLGAQDIGARDIPNSNEGWGRVNLRNTLAPQSGQGIWVDDRSVMSGTGNSKIYAFNVTQSAGLFKVVLTWSDERGSRFSTTQLINDLDLEVTSPDGTTYLGNDFANGRSQTGGTRDTLNNLEVVLIDAALQGTWTVKVKDAQHSGAKTQPYAIAVVGFGVNDLRPDPKVVAESFAMDVGIPQVNDPVHLTTSFFNFGNVKADTFPIAFQVNGNEISRQSIDLGAGASKVVMWTWTPQTAGTTTLSFIIDPEDIMEEIREDNNRLDIQVNVTAPGVKVETETPSIILQSSDETTTSWDISLINTALVPTNASLETGTVVRVESDEVMPWYVGSTDSNFTMEGQAAESIIVTLVHPSPPLPGTYRIDLLGIDVDNAVNYPYSIDLIVPELPLAQLEYDYEIVPVHPSQPTNISVRFFNDGNAPIGYDLFLEAPAGWQAGFTNLGSEAGATSGSTGLIDREMFRSVGLMFTPPQVMTAAGAQRIVKLTAVSQTEPQQLTLFEIPIQVSPVREMFVNIESSIGTLRPDSTVTLRYSLEHRGNVDYRLIPTFDLPSGWSVTSAVDPIDLPWATSKNIMYTLQGNGNAQSGDIRLFLDNGSTRFTWEGELVVEILPQPSLTFVELELEDGSVFDTPHGSGTHPSGETMMFTWLVGNDATTTWTPSVQLQLDTGLFGECAPVGDVGKGDFIPLICSILIPAKMPPMSEPSFSIVLKDAGVELSTTVGLLVAENEQVGWDVGSVPQFTTGDERQIVVEITNTGNTRLQRQLVLDTSSTWRASIDGTDIIDLDVGQSTLVRINVRADSPGTSTLGLTLSQSPAQDASYRIAIAATGEPVGTSNSAGLSTRIALSLFGAVLFVAFAALGVQLLRNRQPETDFKTSIPLPSLPQLQPPQPTPVIPLMTSTPGQLIVSAPSPTAINPPPMCWSCRKHILTAMRGCPSCGARYHKDGVNGCSASSVTVCVNCQAPAAKFIDA